MAKILKNYMQIIKLLIISSFFSLRRQIMRVKKITNLVKLKVSEYPRIDSIVEGLEMKKELTNNKDVNSSIQSKNKINREIERQAIKNINI